MATIGIILVLYKQKHNLDLLYSSLACQTEKDFRIYLIDNNDNYEEIRYSKMLNEIFAFDIEYIKSPSNLGFAGGNNVGAKKALEDQCKYIFFLNSDTALEKNCIKKLAELAETDALIGVTSPIIFYWSENKENNIIQEYGSFVDFMKYIVKKNLEGMQYSEIEKNIPNSLAVDQVSGAAAFFKAEVLKLAGFWEERYFAYGDEIDIALRIRNAGFKQVVTKEAIVLHNHKWEKNNKNAWYVEYYLIERNKFLYFHKYHLYSNLLFELSLDAIKFPRRLLWFINKCDFKLGLYYLLGIIHGVLNKQGKPNLRII